MTDRYGHPWPGATYNGFSGPTSGAGPDGVLAERPRRVSRRPSRGALIGGGIAAAVALGVALGFVFRPDSHKLAAPPDEEAAVAPRVPIEVNRPAPLPTPTASGKLAVLDPSVAAQARRTAPYAPPARDAAGATVPPPATTVSPEPISPRLPDASPPAVRLIPQMISPQPAPPAQAAREDACASARTRAEAMICADPDLVAADRALNRAYRRALRSGAVSPQDLRADQRDWLGIREDAARRSPGAVADVYEQRIDELNRMADDGPRD
jgi:uncharacterized protein YecT (DUF1311 family)